VSGPTASGDHIEAVLAALRASPDLHELRAPADEMSLLVVEARLGRELPASLKRLYGVMDGCHLFGGNLTIVPAMGPGEMRLLDYSEWLRDAEWPIPDEVVMFGDTGGDEVLGLWFPPDADPKGSTPVVEIGEIFEPDCMSVSGSDFPAFLRGWCAYYLALYEAPAEALRSIGLPVELWPKERTRSIAPYLAWADPALPRPNPDPYKDRLDPPAVRSLVGPHPR
jgi:hypothetical protein